MSRKRKHGPVLTTHAAIKAYDDRAQELEMTIVKLKVIISGKDELIRQRDGQLQFVETNHKWLNDEVALMRKAHKAEVNDHRAVIELLLNRRRYQKRELEYVDEEGQPMNVKTAGFIDKFTMNMVNEAQRDLDKELNRG